jgi:hypothetical protein
MAPRRADGSTASSSRRVSITAPAPFARNKITTEVKKLKETMTIEEAVADLKACGMDEMLAFYLKRYPLERDDEDRAWADMIDVSLAKDPPIDVTPPKDGTGDDTTK